MKTVSISSENMDYLKSMQSGAEAEDQVRYSLNDMVSRLIEDREQLQAEGKI